MKEDADKESAEEEERDDEVTFQGKGAAGLIERAVRVRSLHNEVEYKRLNIVGNRV